MKIKIKIKINRDGITVKHHGVSVLYSGGYSIREAVNDFFDNIDY